MPGKSLTWLVVIVIFLCSAFGNYYEVISNTAEKSKHPQTEGMMFFTSIYLLVLTWRYVTRLNNVCKVKSTFWKDLRERPSKIP